MDVRNDSPLPSGAGNKVRVGRHAIRWLIVFAVFFAHHRDSRGADAPVFERDVLPILRVHCFHCHGDDGEKQAGLDLRLVRWMTKGGESGPAIEPGNPDASRLVARISAGEMPPQGKPVTPAELQVIRQWIAGGALTQKPEPEDATLVSAVQESDRDWWSFRPIVRPPVPQVQHSDQITTDQISTEIDAFLLARLQAMGLGFSPSASKRTFIRRATFDLHGLPPTPEEIAEFEADDSPDAHQRLIDRLLASPRYGERWGRHWLDVAGYADSDGYTVDDTARPHAFRYRDYVIRSIAEDKPFDRFVLEQLAGDELAPAPYTNPTAEQIECLAATSFLRMAPDGTASDPDAKTARNAVVSETIKIVSTSLLGLTVGCAQCHSHKYDPIPQTDYYRLRAIFEPALDWKAWRTPNERLISLYTDADRAAAAVVEAEAAKVDADHAAKTKEFIAATFEKEIAKLPDERRALARAARESAEDKRSPEQVAILKEFPSLNVDAGSLYLYDSKAAEELKKIAESASAIRARKPPEGFVAPLTEVAGSLPETYLFHRGDPDQPRQSVSPGELTVLEGQADGPLPAKDPALATSGRRLAYARRLTSGRHPLVARVLVNRVWMLHFGKGLVATPGDFGRLGEKPSHPELLDWLADEFMKDGWRWKRLHRLIMLSTAYRQTTSRMASVAAKGADRSSESSADAEIVDPDNRTLWRMNTRRLEAESLRDATLAIADKLNEKRFGPPVPVMQDAEGQIVIGEERIDGSAVQLPPEPMGGEEFRRSVYVQVRRTRLLSVLDAFDLPSMEPNCESRNSSTVAPQSLLLLNSDFMLKAAADFAARLERDAGADDQQLVSLAWRLAYGRDPRADEQDLALRFLADGTSAVPAQTPAANGPVAEASPKEGSPPPPTPHQYAIRRLCHALLSSNEFLYVD